MKELFTYLQIEETIQKIADDIMKNYPEEEELIVISLLKGSFIFTADLIRKIKRNIILDFMTVSSYGDSLESSNNVIIHQDISLEIKDKKVIVIDDIIDTGITLFEVKKHLMNMKPSSIEFCCLLNKYERREKDIEVNYIGFN